MRDRHFTSWWLHLDPSTSWSIIKSYDNYFNHCTVTLAQENDQTWISNFLTFTACLAACSVYLCPLLRRMKNARCFEGSLTLACRYLSNFVIDAPSRLGRRAPLFDIVNYSVDDWIVRPNSCQKDGELKISHKRINDTSAVASHRQNRC